MGKIYLLETHLYTKDGEHVYKVGRSDQKGMNRLKDYHKECEIILVIACEDSLKIEAELIKHFKQKYTLYTHREYFVGDKHQMMDDIIEVVRKERVETEKERLEKVEKERLEGEKNRLEQVEKEREWLSQIHNPIVTSKNDEPPQRPCYRDLVIKVKSVNSERTTLQEMIKKDKEMSKNLDIMLNRFHKRIPFSGFI